MLGVVRLGNRRDQGPWPALEIRPSRAFPLVECRRGTSPSQDAKARADLNCAMSGAKAATASAVTGANPRHSLQGPRGVGLGREPLEGADDLRKSRFTEAQIIGMIKEHEAGLPSSELCRKHGLILKEMGGIAGKRRRFGYRRIGILLERKGITMNHKKLYRLYREEGLSVRRLRGRKRARGSRSPMPQALRPNQR